MTNATATAPKGPGITPSRNDHVHTDPASLTGNLNWKGQRMALTDELAAATRPPGHRCQLSKALAEMPEEEEAEFRDAIAGDDWSAAAVSRVLISHGHQITAPQVLRHRNNICRACGPNL